MIFAASILTQVVIMPHLIEFPVAEGEVVAIEALIKLPRLEPGYRFRLEQAAFNAVKMTPQYGKRDISRILAPGYRFRIDQVADALRLGLTVEPKDLGAGLSVLSSVLTEPTFLPDAIKVEPSLKPNVWQRASRAYESVPMDVDQFALQETWRFVVRPEAITVGVRGPIVAGVASRLWRERERFWKEYQSGKSLSGRPPKLSLDVNLPPVALFTSQVSTLTPLDVQAATLLGAGKDSILWRVCRETERLSYQQDAFLLPTSDGWEFRIAIPTDSKLLQEGAIANLQKLLLKEVDHLTESNLIHASGLIMGFLEYGQSGLPIRVGQTLLTGGDMNEVLFRDLYFDFKKSPSLSSPAWRSAAELSRVKERLRTLIQDAKISVR